MRLGILRYDEYEYVTKNQNLLIICNPNIPAAVSVRACLNNIIFCTGDSGCDKHIQGNEWTRLEAQKLL